MTAEDIAMSDMMDQDLEFSPVSRDTFIANVPRTLCFGPWQFTPETGELADGERIVRLEPVVADVLAVLLHNAGRVVSRDRILECVWKDRVVVDESVTRAISRIRSVLGDTKKPYRYIETLPKRGYRLVWPSSPDTICPG